MNNRAFSQPSRWLLLAALTQGSAACGNDADGHGSQAGSPDGTGNQTTGDGSGGGSDDGSGGIPADSEGETGRRIPGPYHCDGLEESACREAIGCYWDDLVCRGPPDGDSTGGESPPATGDSAPGDPGSCSEYNRWSCEDASGCRWDGTSCAEEGEESGSSTSGTEDPCAGRGRFACSSVSGCTWDRGSNRCVPE